MSNTSNRTDKDREADALERLEFYAGQQRMFTGQPQKCPRCGYLAIKPRLATNALSRLSKPSIYVCDACGSEEGIESIPGHDRKPVTEWAAVRIPDWRCTV